MPTETVTAQDLMTGVRRIVFAGDSLTDGGGWADWVVETLQANGHPGLVMHNAGVAGNTTAMLRARYAADVLALKPDLVIVNIGTNDRVPTAEYRRDLEDIVQRTRRTGARMLLLVPPAVRDPGRNEQMHAGNDVVRDLAQLYGCGLADLHAAFEQDAAAGKEMWGPDGIHHRLEGWRTMARCTLAALGCTAAALERTTLYPQALTDWYISPPVPWKPVPLRPPPAPASPPPRANQAPSPVSLDEYPPPPILPDGFDPVTAGWRRFDRETEIQKTSWWQVSWLARGGIMPMGQDAVPGSPGAASRDAGAFALAIVKSETASSTILHVGGSPPYAVWLNGELVWNGYFLHGYHPDADRFPVTLRQGVNHLLVFTNWLFYVSLGEF